MLRNHWCIQWMHWSWLHVYKLFGWKVTRNTRISHQDRLDHLDHRRQNQPHPAPWFATQHRKLVHMQADGIPRAPLCNDSRKLNVPWIKLRPPPRGYRLLKALLPLRRLLSLCCLLISSVQPYSLLVNHTDHACHKCVDQTTSTAKACP